MESNEVRKRFLDYFKSKRHEIVPSAPMVVKDDATLMFTNAGMNQFKDIFLGNKAPKSVRVADSQKCLRVSGKHNDLEEVGHDTYHHTMFEMLGNWSFGDYFKEGAIDFAWELLTKEYNISAERLYATVFEGNPDENVEFDNEAKKCWLKYLPEDRILKGSKKDNFWEMGETGPCGPCSELHIDIRDDEERQKLSAVELINKDHPQVIEIWNLVFIQYNRKADGTLTSLPQKHVDTGMGFERLCMVVQGKKSNYDTDVFQPIIKEISEISGIAYGADEKTDIAMRVIADHIRAIVFAIADGQLPYRDGAGYVIRRILRRAVRYGFTFLNFDEPFMEKLLPVLIETLGNAYPELKMQYQIIAKVITEEENSFLRTLAKGIKRLEQITKSAEEKNEKIIEGKIVFELYDTYGFPDDLTELILKEKNFGIDRKTFNEEREKRKKMSQQASHTETDDWITLKDIEGNKFIGYENITANVNITRYRKVKTKKKELYQLVFDVTPFYAESGGQIGDTGYIEFNGKKINIINTIKDNNLNIHLVEKLPENPEAELKAVVNTQKRALTECNHSATHLMHYALRKVLGEHVEQKGSLVEPDRLRFDFSHFEKVTNEQIAEVERIVNDKIRQNIIIDEKRNISFKQAEALGAIALFGEKYGDTVRVIKFDDSIELCGGTHVAATGKIGFFKIISEGAIAAGIRRIEAITSKAAEEYIREELNELEEIKVLFKKPKHVSQNVKALVDENQKLKKQIEALGKEKAKMLKNELLSKVEDINGINVITAKVEVDSAAILKDIAFMLKKQIDNLYLALGSAIDNKANLAVMISENLVKDKNLHAGNIIREISKEIQGGGGGQPFFASAGGKNPDGIDKALELAKQKVM